MNNKVPFSFFFSLFLAFSPAFVSAEENVQSKPIEEQKMEKSPFSSKPPSMVKEAAVAVFGRIFGAQGQGGEIDYHTVDMVKHTPSNAAIRSALVPGWGQGFNGQKKKGILLFTVTATTALGSYLLHEKAQSKYDDYLASGVRNDSNYNDYENAHLQSNVLAVVAAIFWGYSIIDAAKNAYNPLWTKDTHIDVAMAPNGDASVKWERKF